MSNFVKKNQNIENYFIRKEFIVFQTDKASFINLPNHNRHIGFWLSNKFIYPSEKHSEQVAIGLIYDNSYPIVKYDENLKRHIWKYLTGTELINLYNQYKQNYFNRIHKALFSNETKKVKVNNNNNNLTNWSVEKEQELINDWEKLKEFFIHVFLFINKTNVESITTWTLTQNEYLTLMVGVWIVILFLTWFLLWMIFKIVGYFK